MLTQGAFVEPADQVEQQLAARLGKAQIAEFVENEEIDTGEPIGDAAMAPTLASVSIRDAQNPKASQAALVSEPKANHRAHRHVAINARPA